MGLALYLVSRYTSQFSKLPAGSRAAYPVVIAIVLLPVAWPYAERLVAQHRCADFQKLDQFSVFRTESIRLEFQGDGDIFTPHYLLIDTAGNSEWIFKNNVRSIVSENGTTEFTRHASGEKCDSATSGDPYGRDLCRKSTNETNSPANLKVIFKTAAGADKKGSTTEVSFLDAQSNGKVATFHPRREKKCDSARK